MKKHSYYSLSNELHVSVKTIKKAANIVYSTVDKRLDNSQISELIKQIVTNPEGMGPEIKNQEKYHAVYKQLLEKGFLYRADIGRLFNTSDNNIDRILDNFDELGLLLYEDEKVFKKNPKSICKAFPNTTYTKIIIHPFEPLKKELQLEKSLVKQYNNLVA